MSRNRFTSTPENLEILQQLANLLRELPVGETLPNNQIDNLTRGKKYLVYRAREVVEKETGCVFGTAIRQGIKKLEGGAVHNVGTAARQSASRKLGKARRRLVGWISGPIGMADLDNSAKLKAMREISMLGLALEFTDKKEEIAE